MPYEGKCIAIMYCLVRSFDFCTSCLCLSQLAESTSEQCLDAAISLVAGKFVLRP